MDVEEIKDKFRRSLDEGSYQSSEEFWLKAGEVLVKDHDNLLETRDKLKDRLKVAQETWRVTYENIVKVRDSLRELVEKAARYHKAKIAQTLCLQEHFKQLCTRCPEYQGRCEVYSEYVDAWMALCKALANVKEE